MQIKSQNKRAFEKGGHYAKELEMVVARDRRNLRRNNDIINDNKIQQK